MDLPVISENDSGEQWIVSANLSNLNTIRELKEHLKKKLKEGFSVELLIYNGKELLDSTTIDSCGFTEDSKVYGKKKVIRIIIDLAATQRNLKPIEMKISRTETTEALIEKVSEKVESIDKNNTCLMYNGQYLQVGTRLCDQNIENNTYLQVASRLSGGRKY